MVTHNRGGQEGRRAVAQAAVRCADCGKTGGGAKGGGSGRVYRAGLKRYDKPLCRGCYDRRRNVVRRARRAGVAIEAAWAAAQTALAPGATVGQVPDAAASAGEERAPLAEPEPSPAERAAVRQAGRAWFRASGLRCAEEGEAVGWYVGAVRARGYGAAKLEEGDVLEEADLQTFCADALPDWCALQRAAGRCVRADGELG